MYTRAGRVNVNHPTHASNVSNTDCNSSIQKQRGRASHMIPWLNRRSSLAFVLLQYGATL